MYNYTSSHYWVKNILVPDFEFVEVVYNLSQENNLVLSLAQ